MEQHDNTGYIHGGWLQGTFSWKDTCFNSIQAGKWILNKSVLGICETQWELKTGDFITAGWSGSQIEMENTLQWGFLHLKLGVIKKSSLESINGRVIIAD